ncbi:siderophore-interacting protein [Ornithinimicrobium cryptoxanthini]|uniref:Siderophore-interacting protein n=1 Tax=Ornithinimicrobium cryptoxanthini TaxID=2934161 RepID=A0ABY4YM42_9MICO|nr:siderophore-interacting protein [Ornithinimicrobium cryptoxanthini]USQ77857.1 siderophore-interacting protein [Ornithinimicrobium cryptoxanthini]
MSQPNRPPRPQAVLTVESSQWVSPTTVRLVAGGPGFSELSFNDFTDAYVKLVFVRPELGLTPPYDEAALREQLPPEDWPVRRTYTLRWVDRTSERLAIDFVVHGDDGFAAPWARNARPGDQFSLSGAGGAYSPDLTADWHLFIGDESAMPAIAAALERLPSDARGAAFFQVTEESGRFEITGPVGIRQTWLVGPAEQTTLLADAAAAWPWPHGRVHVFAHGERESMKAVRAVLKERGVPREDLSLSGYWANGRTEDRFQAEKREPIGKIPD